MSQQRQNTCAAIIDSYSLLRLKLTDAERPLFDKAVSLLEELSYVDTPKTLALDSALIVGLLAVNPHPPTLNHIVKEMTRVVIEVAEAEGVSNATIEEVARGRGNRN